MTSNISPIWSYVNENEKKKKKKCVKNQKFKILKNKQTKKKKWSGGMVNRYLPLKFGVNPLGGFQENEVYGRRTPTSWQ